MLLTNEEIMQFYFFVQNDFKSDEISKQRTMSEFSKVTDQCTSIRVFSNRVYILTVLKEKKIQMIPLFYRNYQNLK